MTSLDAALDAATQRQDDKRIARPGLRPKVRPGPGPDRPMPYIAAIPARDMLVHRVADGGYQRELDHAWVRRTVREWDPTMLGVIDVSDRGEQSRPRFAVIDGQHRRAVAIEADPRGEDVPLVCNVHRGLTLAEEALLFHEIDATRRRLTSWDRWNARRAAGDRVVLEVEEVARGFDLRCAPGQNDGYVGAVGALEHLHSIGGAALVARTLRALHAAYGRAYNGYLAPLVSGVGLLLHYYPDINPERLDAALTKTTPQQLRAQAVTRREYESGALYRLVAQTLIDRINASRGPKLPALRDHVPPGRMRPTPSD
jgi:hypothetical protein